MNQIETKFFNELITTLKNGSVACDNKIYKVIDNGYEIENGYEIIGDNFYINFSIECQPKEESFNGYIPDFALFINGLFAGYAIEIDGYEWHEKTKEQAIADRRKDRAYIKNNFIPVRFLGGEVFHSSKDCVRELIEIIIHNVDFFNRSLI